MPGLRDHDLRYHYRKASYLVLECRCGAEFRNVSSAVAWREFDEHVELASRSEITTEAENA